MRIVRTVALSLAVVAVVPLAISTRAIIAAQPAPAQAADAPSRPADAAGPRPVATMSELMIRVIYPTSDAVFYIGTRVPASDAEWSDLQTKLLMLAESANLLMMPGRTRDNDRWMADAKLMLDVGQAAYRAARAKNVEALEALNDQLYQSCVQCHQHYRPGYGQRRP
jgi:hypothetical protein